MTTTTGTPITVGRIVFYMLSETDAGQINRRRTTGPAIFARMQGGDWPEGAQAHIGPDAHEGDVLPMIVTKTDGAVVNGQVILDGTDVLWVRLIAQGAEPGTWHWPPRG